MTCQGSSDSRYDSRKKIVYARKLTCSAVYAPFLRYFSASRRNTVKVHKKTLKFSYFVSFYIQYSFRFYSGFFNQSLIQNLVVVQSLQSSIYINDCSGEIKTHAYSVRGKLKLKVQSWIYLHSKTGPILSFH